MYVADYATRLKSPQALWVGGDEHGRTVRGLIRLLPSPVAWLQEHPETFLDRRDLIGIQLVFVDYADEDAAWLPQILDFLSQHDHVSVIALSQKNVRLVPRGVDDFAVLPNLDVWGLERLISLAVARKSLGLSDAQHDLDALTGVLPRSALGPRLREHLHDTPSIERPLALILIDVDRLTQLNESSSDEVGDKVLVAIARALDKGLLPRDSVFRMDGGCFGVLCPSINGSIAVFKVVDKIQALLAPILELPELGMPLTYSMGVALFPDGTMQGDKLTQSARVALSQAKRQRGISCRYFTQSMEQTARRQHSMEAALQRALRREEFVLQYQPQIDLRDGSITRLEALVRWEHTQGEWVGPGEFLKAADQVGVLIGLGHWVMHQVCSQMAGLGNIPLVINVGHSQVADPSFVDTVLRIVAQSEMPFSRIGFEMNEETLQHNPEEIAQRVRHLTSEGMGFGLDNFGQGFSSLRNLEYLPLSWVKIDREFFGRHERTDARTNIVRAMLGLSEQFGFEAVAKGVESAEEQSFVETLGFNQAQGFQLQSPLSYAELKNYLINRAVARKAS